MTHHHHAGDVHPAPTIAPSLLRLLGALQARGGTVQRQLLEEQFPRIAQLLTQGDGSAKTTPEPRKSDTLLSFEGHTEAVRAV